MRPCRTRCLRRVWQRNNILVLVQLRSCRPQRAVSSTRAQKRIHVEAGLVAMVPERSAHRTRPARSTAMIHAVLTGTIGQIPSAGWYLVVIVVKRCHRACRETWLLFAGVTRACLWFHGRYPEPLSEGERTAIAVPEPITGMDQNTERRRVAGLGLARPALKRQVRRQKRVQGDGTEAARNIRQYILRPVV